MTGLLRAFRRSLLAPSPASVSFAARGFPATPSPVTRHLEAIPHAVVCGFEWGMEASGPAEIEARIRLVEPSLQGFAYEGATMSAVVLDAMSGFRGARTRDLLVGPARPHIALAYIGIGFAMARLPRRLWGRVVPDLDGVPYHPTMSWLAVDGYAFDRAYFDMRTWVDGQRLLAPYPWEGRAHYFPRAADQGIGRALWFVHGAVTSDVVAAVRRFDGNRQADLWSGVGLAATMAGGASRAGLRLMRLAAGEHAPQLGLGAVLGGAARSLAGAVPRHTALATETLAGLPVAAAVTLAEDAEPAADAGSGTEPRYETWRAAIRARVAGHIAAAA